jgi:hypothetical protein
MMTGMDVVSSVDFPAVPAVVFAMITDPAFHDRVAERAHSHHHEFSVSGSVVHVVRAFESPGAISKLVGPDITIVELVEWAAPAADGSRHGTFTVTVEGKPVTWRGTTTLLADGARTVLTYSGEFTVAIPFLGKALEKQAVEPLENMVQVQREVGAEYLAEHG